MKRVSTLTALKEGLRTAMLIATGTARLTRVPGVDLLNGDSASLRFIANEAIELGKRPRMQTSLLAHILLVLAPSHLRGFSNVSQVLKHNRATCGRVLDNTFGEDMITVSVESPLLLRQLFQVSLRRLCSFRLQGSSETQRATVNFFPLSRAKKLTVTRDGGSVQSQINSDDLISSLELRLRNTDNNVKGEPSLFVNEISSAWGIALILGAVGRNAKRDTHASLCRRQAYYVGLPVEDVGFLIIAYWTEFTVRTLDRLELWSRFPLLQGILNLLGIRLFVFDLPSES